MARAPFQVLVIPYRVGDDGRFEYAIFRRADRGVWQAIAGGGEDNETAEAAAQREAFEEAGLPPSSPLVPLRAIASIPASEFAASASWGAAVTAIPEYAFGMAATEVRLSQEHSDVAWLSYEEAMQRLEWESNRIALRELHESLTRRVSVRSISLLVDAVELARCRALLSDEELARAARFRFEEHARRFAVARAFMRRTLGEVLDRAPESVVIRTSERGKPFVDGVEFNLSHSDELAVIAVGKHRVGVDVERVRERERLFDIARRFFAPDEVEALSSVPPDEREHAFYRIWTAKEAYLKALGDGISLPLDWFAVSIDRDLPRLIRARGDDATRWELSRVDAGDGYVCTLAIERV